MLAGGGTWAALILGACALLGACGQKPPPASPAASAPASESVRPDMPFVTPLQLDARQASYAEAVTPQRAAKLEYLVRVYLDTAQARYGPSMASLSDEPDRIAAIQQGADARFPLTLRGGQRYLIVAACDHECLDLDLELIDQRGSAVAQSIGPGDYPDLDVTPEADGAFDVRLLMRRCTIDPCYAGVRLLVP